MYLRTSGSSIKSEVLHLKTLPISTPLKLSVKMNQLHIQTAIYKTQSKNTTYIQI